MLVFRGGPNELEQVGSTDSSLAVPGLHGGGVIANLVAMGVSGRSQEGPAVWVGLLALLPLVLLLLSGLYLFLLPYATLIRD